MASVTINPSYNAGFRTLRLAPASAFPDTVVSIQLSAVATATTRYATANASSALLLGSMDNLHAKVDIANAFSLSGITFVQGGKRHVMKATGEIQRDISAVTGNGTAVGAVLPTIGDLALTDWSSGSTPQLSEFRGVAAAPINGVSSPYGTYAVTFRLATAPIRPSSFSLLGVMADGTTVNVTADANGYINATRVKGRVNYTTGVVTLVFVTPSVATGQQPADLSFLGIPGVTTAYVDLVRQETLRYNAVAYTYLPLDAALLGIDPVRLPSDGRVPIYKPGAFVVVGHKQVSSPVTAVNGATLNLGRTRLSRIRVRGANGLTIGSGYSVNLETGVVTWTDVTGYSQPVTVEDRVEDMAQLKEANINGNLVLLRQLTHNYPVGSYVSSAFVPADLKARYTALFDQGTWDGITFKDSVDGAVAPGTYNDIAFPIQVTNGGALTERWGLRFTSTQGGVIIGEHLGQIGTFSVNTVTAPMNDATGKPYFTIPVEGWGTGWGNGNGLRFNTVEAGAPLWLAQTIQQGPEAGLDYSFSVLVRGNIDNPI